MYIDRCWQADRQTDREEQEERRVGVCWEGGRLTDRPIDRQTDRQTERQTNRETERGGGGGGEETETPTDRQKEIARAYRCIIPRNRRTLTKHVVLRCPGVHHFGCDV